MSRIIARLLPSLLLVLFHLHPDNAEARQRYHSPSLNLGDAVVAGFSKTPVRDAAKPPLANKNTS